MENLKDFGECIVFLQAAVIKKFLQGFMAPKQKKRKPQSEEAAAKAEEQDEEKRMAEEAKVWIFWGVFLCSSFHKKQS